MLRSILILLFLPPYVLIGSFVGYALARLAGSPRVLYRLGRFGARTALTLAGTKVVFEGLEPLLRDPRNVVVMPNHESNLDAPILFGLVPIDFKAIYKREIDRFPFFGQALHYAGLIDVNRSDKADARRALDRAAESLSQGNTFVVFPEGTRSRTGKLGPFKKGGLVIAIEAGSRIFPVAIKGARPLLPRGRFGVRPGTVTVRVLDPVDAAAYSYEDRERLAVLVRDRIAAELGPVSAFAATVVSGVA
jgi:1-acyl-sn-glycerol-3-phosphate acyltransferase